MCGSYEVEGSNPLAGTLGPSLVGGVKVGWPIGIGRVGWLVGGTLLRRVLEVWT